MVTLDSFFGYQKWFSYEAHEPIAFFTHSTARLLDVSSLWHQSFPYFLGISEWLFGALPLAGFSNKKLGILSIFGSVVTFLCIVTIIPFMPDGRAPSAGRFSAMVGNVAFLMKVVVLLAVSFYLLKQDLIRATTRKNIFAKLEALDTIKEFGA